MVTEELFTPYLKTLASKFPCFKNPTEWTAFQLTLVSVLLFSQVLTVNRTSKGILRVEQYSVFGNFHVCDETVCNGRELRH